MFILIGISGIPYLIEKPYIFGVKQLNIISLFFLLSLYQFIKSRKKMEPLPLLVILLLSLITVGQTFIFGKFEIDLFLSLIIRFMIPYFVIRLLEEKFFKYYVNVLYFFCIISLILFLPSQVLSFYNSLVLKIGNVLNLDLYPHRQSFIIYSIDSGHSRNAGPFWEAGAFSIFVLLAIIFNYFNDRTLFSKKNIVFIVSTITTFSTAGYLSLIFLVFMYLTYISKRQSKFYVMILFSAIFAYIFFSSDFLYEKISSQYEQQTNAVDQINNLGRFQSALLDFRDISQYPIFGRGRGDFRYDATEYFFEYGAARRSNGLTDFIAKQGIPFSILFFFLCYKAFANISVNFKVKLMYGNIAFASLMIAAFSQLLFTHPLFAGLIFLNSSFRKNN